jgi:hypothetical protein
MRIARDPHEVALARTLVDREGLTLFDRSPRCDGTAKLVRGRGREFADGAPPRGGVVAICGSVAALRARSRRPASIAQIAHAGRHAAVMERVRAAVGPSTVANGRRDDVRTSTASCAFALMTVFLQSPPRSRNDRVRHRGAARRAQRRPTATWRAVGAHWQTTMLTLADALMPP